MGYTEEARFKTMEQRDWYYLLPDGITTAENMLEGCEKMRKQAGHKFSADAFRSLVRKDVIKKINRITHSIHTRRDADNFNGANVPA